MIRFISNNITFMNTNITFMSSISFTYSGGGNLGWCCTLTTSRYNIIFWLMLLPFQRCCNNITNAIVWVKIDVVGDVVTFACWEKLPFSAPINWILLQFWQVIAESLCQLSYFIKQFKICNNLAARGPNAKSTLKVCHVYISIWYAVPNEWAPLISVPPARIS